MFGRVILHHGWRGSMTRNSRMFSGQVEQRHAFDAGALESAGIDVAGFADVDVALDVGVALQEKIVLLIGQETVAQFDVIAVDEGNALVVECEVAECAVALDVDALGVALKADAVEVAVAPDEGGGKAGEVVEDGRGADVAAVDEEFRAALAQERDCFGDGGGIVVRVAEDAEEHGEMVSAGAGNCNAAGFGGCDYGRGRVVGGGGKSEGCRGPAPSGVHW